jgi:hypothetical protein
MASSLSQSYDKIVLVVGLIAGLGLGALAFLGAKKVSAQYEVSPSPQAAAPPLAGEKKITAATESLGKQKSLPQGTVEGGRKADMFTGIAWFLPKDSEQPVDLLAPDEPPVHDPIPNVWWIENGIDPGYADSPDRDADNDGFTNEEEFLAETDPQDPSDHPPLGSKLRLVSLEKLSFLLNFSSDIGDNQYQFKYEDTKPAGNRTDGYVGRGDSFFKTTPALQRFRLKEVVEEEVVNERTKVASKRKFAFVEDLKPNKSGKTYKIPRGIKAAERKLFIQRDYTAVLVLAAVGQGAIEFKVEENTRFSLPFDENAAEKPYLFREVRNDGTVVFEWQEDGGIKTLELLPPAE